MTLARKEYYVYVTVETKLTLEADSIFMYNCKVACGVLVSAAPVVCRQILTTHSQHFYFVLKQNGKSFGKACHCHGNSSLS